MEIPGRRSNYTLLSQVPDDHHHPQPPKFSAEAGGASERGFDWELVDHRAGRVGSAVSIGLQRQSSGSTFGESSISGEYYTHEDVFKVGGGSGGEARTKAAAEGSGSWSASKSWAQQTEESYQLQLALALRLSSEATCADDPNFLDPVLDESTSRSLGSTNSAESISHRFWVNGCLSYFDRIPDGFYLIHGMDPYVWTVCTDLQENGRIPSIESLKAIDPSMDSSIEVILIDRRTDTSLKELQNMIHSVSCSCVTTEEVIHQLAKIVCNRMGIRGAASTGEDDFVPMWKECCDNLKECLRSIVLPIGSLSVGLCRHRALLFKVLADTIDLPCRVAKGCKYCMTDGAASCLVRFGPDREYLVDLIGKPGCLCAPDSLLNGPSSILISSPLCFPRFRQVEPLVDFRSLAKQFFSDFESLNIVFDDSSSGAGLDGDAGDSTYPKQSVRQFMDIHSHVPSSSDSNETYDRDFQLVKSCNPHAVISSTNVVKNPVPRKHFQPIGHREVQPLLGFSDPRGNTGKDLRFIEGSQMVPIKPSKEISLDVEDLDIPWSDLVLKERIGSGSFGTVHRADWHGSEVAVKILMDQDFHPERIKEFLREVAIMKRLRHPNIVLFMGAVTQPPNLSIVTEYLSRGSLYRLLHKPGAREVLDERRRLSMAYDVAKGMNYLHNRNPPIVHRDLKSPNLLVDKKYTVKVCDFGLSRLKANTFLSSKSAAGTPEWMAPEVLRDEPSNEKSDVYSFGVILWEIATLQQPWSNLNPAQVVAAVGFKCKRLDIPRNLNPHVASIIEACWANEPLKRPSFSSIMESLRPLIKPPMSQPVRADMKLVT
ncbi:protein kinase superfamily protein [Actinidia rufa]|uniref:non-specific serine/threonine protein kinase n=2 Tax=Actinidia TaxID=3624 RepID=A0A7J0E8C7_9ERIC|nr:protein kinase superfamily protein [Actinidia rufa]